MKSSFLFLLLPLALVTSGCETSMSEDAVREYYRLSEKATLERKPRDLCALIDTEFSATITSSVEGIIKTEVLDRAKACDGTEKVYAAWEKLGEAMDGIVQLDSKYTIHSISLSPDKKTATVDISSSLDVAGAVMNIRSRTTETLVIKRGRVLTLRSEGVVVTCTMCETEPVLPVMAKISPGAPSQAAAKPIIPIPVSAANAATMPTVQKPVPALAKDIPLPVGPATRGEGVAGVPPVSLTVAEPVTTRRVAPVAPQIRRAIFGSADLRRCLDHQSNLDVARCVERLDPAPVPSRDSI